VGPIERPQEELEKLDQVTGRFPGDNSTCSLRVLQPTSRRISKSICNRGFNRRWLNVQELS
jgi:hypothetical protein